MKKRLPAIVLFLLAPAIGELLSGSSPPAEFFKPFPFLLLAVLYGGGTLIVRELTLRWGGGWRQFMLLAITYGIVEEGLMAKSFFDPAWMDLGLLATYGRLLGVNWVWSVNLTIYHMSVSILVPVLLAQAVFHSRAGDRWLGRGALRFVVSLFLADVVFGFLFTPFRPPALTTLICIAIIVVLIVLARRAKPTLHDDLPGSLRRARWFLPVGFIGMATFFLSCMWALPEAGVPPLVTMAVAVLIAAFTWWLVARMSGHGRLWEDVHRVAFAAGLLLPYILIAPIRETDAASTDDPSGMTLVAIAFAVLLLVLLLQARRRSRTGET